MQKTVKEICLVCKGERWIPDPSGGARSRPCPYCDESGWVQVAPSSLGETAPAAGPESPPAPAPPPQAPGGKTKGPDAA